MVIIPFKTTIWKDQMKKPKKRGRKPGVKVGPYKMNLTQLMNEVRDLRSRVAKLEKVLG